MKLWLILALAAIPARAEDLASLLAGTRALPQDIRLRPELRPEPHQLPLVLNLMRAPLTALSESSRTAAGFAAVSPVEALAQLLARMGEPYAENREILAPEGSDRIFKALSSDRSHPAALSSLRSLAGAKRKVGEAAASLSVEALDAAVATLRARLTESLPDPKRLLPGEIWEERDEIDLESAASFDRLRLYGAALQAADAAEDLAVSSSAWQFADLPRRFTLEGLDVCLGTAGDDVHESVCDVILDPAGNDVYRPQSLEGRRGGLSVIIDYAGNDAYMGGEFGSIAAGVAGVSLLFDLGGDDAYVGRDGALGAGLLGVGLLWDASGSDVYRSRAFSQGAGAFGLGLLLDDEGSDIYRASYLSQAMGFVRGAGLLRDTAGNDAYSSGFSVPDPRGASERYGNFRQGTVFQSLSQGFGYGWRGQAGGGLGFLLDFEGNDQYLCDYFGQGSAYWFGWGLLFDGGGNDSYLSRRYAQGAGVHFAVGTLLDAGGNDRYQGWAVSQGAGHDFSLGLLWDGAGNDAYSGDWSHMGLSNANGFGIFRDQDGADRYAFSPYAAAASYWDEKREGAGVGLFLDGGTGPDHFAESPSSTVWNPTRWSAGVSASTAALPELTLAVEPEGAADEAAYKAAAAHEGEFLKKRWRHAEGLGQDAYMSELLAIGSGWGIEGSVTMSAKRTYLTQTPGRLLPKILARPVTKEPFAGWMYEEYLLSAPESATGIAALLTSSSESVRARGAAWLGKLRANPESLISGAKDASWRVRAAATRAAAFQMEAAFRTRVSELAEALEKSDMEAAKKVLRAGKKFETMWFAARASGMKREEWARLADGLIEDWTQPEVADAAAEFLARESAASARALRAWTLNAPDSRSILFSAVQDSDSEVRRWAAWGLGMALIEPARLAPLFGDGDYGVRETAAAALSKFGASALPIIKTLLSSSSALTRAVATKAIPVSAGKPARALLEQSARDKESSVRLAAVEGLAEGARGGAWKVSAAEAKKMQADSDAWVAQAAKHAFAAPQ